MDVKLPKLGEGAESGVVVNIAVKEGEQINKGQTIIELENEKAVAAIPSSAAGKVKKINVKTGDRISVGQVLVVLEGAASAPSGTAETKAAKPAKTTAKRAAAPESQPEEEDVHEAEEEMAGESAAERAGLPIAASPSGRKLARDIGLDLHLIRGSEVGGRIVLEDIQEYIKRLQKLAARGKGAPSTAPAPEKKTPAESIDFSQWGPVNKKPLSPIRLTISKRMVENAVSIPHVTQFDDADVTRLTELRKKYADAYEKKGARLTLTSFALKAVANTLKKF